MGRWVAIVIACVLAIPAARADDKKPDLALDGKRTGASRGVERGAAASVAHAVIVFPDPVDRPAIDAAVRAPLVAIQKCLKTAKWKVRIGDVVAFAVVAPGGTVARADAGGHDTVATNCVKKGIAAVKAPATPRGGAIAVVMHLETKGESLTKTLDKLDGKDEATLTGLQPDKNGVAVAPKLDAKVSDAGAGKVPIATAGPAKFEIVSASMNDDPIDPAAIRGAIAAQNGSVAACGDAPALVFVAVDRAGKPVRALAAGTGDAKQDRCVEKAIKPAAFTKTKRGGALVVRYGR